MMYKLLVVFSVFCAAGAQMLLKQGARRLYPALWKQYINPWVISGYCVLAMSLLVNVFCLNHGVQIKEVSIIESLSYLFVPVFSCFFFREQISKEKALAIVIIIIGIIAFFV